MNPNFFRAEAADISRLIADYPLAWVLSPGAAAGTAALLPLLGRYDEEGELVALVGHMSRERGLHATLTETPAAQFLFTGPQGYVSPEDAGRRNWGPTWNFAAVQVEGVIRFDEALTAAAVGELVTVCEAGRSEPWQPSELGTRYSGMLGAIIGFEARVTRVDATFKLAQDEDDEVLGRLVERHPNADLRTWMRAANRDRLG